MKFGRPGTGGRGKAHDQEPASLALQLPEHGATVTLYAGPGEGMPARVLDSSAGALRVAIMVPAAPLGAAGLQSAVVEFIGSTGRVRLTGAAVMEDAEVLRFDSPRSLDVVQEREYVRLRSARPVLLFGGEDYSRVDGCTVDISGGGFLLAGGEALKVGDEVQFELQLTLGELPVCGSGKVVRIDARGHRGVVFEDIKDLDRRRLVRFIFECQRAELRMGLATDEHHGG
ncbi:MAG TPA: PilZ domain-containing protein [Solirubrobacteraceae bacterium]|nr:PilZ domain-containing protein [Solirubrobacteraceae bacterium]